MVEEESFILLIGREIRGFISQRCSNSRGYYMVLVEYGGSG